MVVTSISICPESKRVLIKVIRMEVSFDIVLTGYQKSLNLGYPYGTDFDIFLAWLQKSLDLGYSYGSDFDNLFVWVTK